jgi:septum site-determining protein MinD
MRSIIVASGKGGVGKTTLSLNLGLALAQMKKKVVVVDADVTMANLGVMLGVEQTPISLNNVMRGEIDIKDAVYEGPLGLKYVPAGLSTDKAGRIDLARLKDAVKELGVNSEYVIVDSPPGLDMDSENAIKSCQEMILIVTPEPTSLADAIKIKNLAERKDIKITGIVFNMVSGSPEEIHSKDVATVLQTPILVEIPFDFMVRRATAAQQPAIIRYPDSEFSASIRLLANKITGATSIDSGVKVKKGILQSIIDAVSRIFSGPRDKAQ